MDTLAQDLRHALRKLRKSPGFTFIAVLTLALGIGANTAIFSVVDAVLLRSLPFAEPEQLVAINTVTSRGGGGPFSGPDLADVRDRSRVFTEVVGVDGTEVTLAGESEPERIQAARVTADFFRAFGISMLHGRGFGEGEDQAGRSRVVVLGHGLWQRRFGADPGIVGQTIRLEEEAYTVVGVAPPGADFPNEAQLWIPFTWGVDISETDNRGAHSIAVYARLRPGVKIEQAGREVSSIMAELEKEYPDSNAGFGAEVRSLRDQLVGDVRPALLVILGAVGLVLLIACANLSNLLLARAASREGEISLRLALGAGRARIVRQLLVESAVLALAGGAAGLLLAVWGLDLLTTLGPRDIPRLDEVSVDATVLGFTLVLTLATAVLFGLLPALQSSRTELATTLREVGRSGKAGARSGRVRNLLIVSETALAVMLLVGAGLLLRSFIRLQQVDPGFRAEHVLTMTVSLPQSSYPFASPAALDFFDQALERIRALPGVQSAGTTFLLPLSGSGMISSLVDEAKPEPEPGQFPVAQIHVASPGFIQAMGIEVKRGRAFTDEDRAGGSRVVLVNEEAARRYWPGEDPIGRTVEIGISFTDSATLGGTVVGVVGDVKHEAINAEPFPAAFVPFAQAPTARAVVVVRTAGDPLALASAAGAEIRALDRDVPVSDIRTMEAVVGESVAQPRFYALLIGTFAVLALLLAAVGIYGVVANAVAHRTQEFGIRMALGADPGRVVALVLRQYMRLAATGLGLGLLLAFAGSRVLASMLYGVRATDPLTFTGVAALLGAVALAASLVPALRATHVDPIRALKHE